MFEKKDRDAIAVFFLWRACDGWSGCACGKAAANLSARRAHASLAFSALEWRNWQTRETQNLVPR
jgi:hypothetical protein